MRKDTSSRYMCSLCKEKFPFEDIKYSKDGKNIVCTPCYNKSKEKGSGLFKEYTTLNPQVDSIKVICIDCNYHFSLKKKSNLRCPYCSETRIMKDNITADKLLEEVSMGKNIV